VEVEIWGRLESRNISWSFADNRLLEQFFMGPNFFFLALFGSFTSRKGTIRQLHSR